MRTPLSQSTRRMIAYVCLAAGGVLGFTRLQVVDGRLDRATENNAHNAMVAKQLAQEVATNVVSNCKQRNTAQRNGRDRFVRFFQNLDGVLSSVEQGRRFTEALAEGIVLDPKQEDQDCNNDGVLNENDYSHAELTDDSVLRNAEGVIVQQRGPAVQNLASTLAEQAKEAQRPVQPQPRNPSPEPTLVPLPAPVPDGTLDPVEKPVAPLEGALCSLTSVLDLCRD